MLTTTGNIVTYYIKSIMPGIRIISVFICVHLRLIFLLPPEALGPTTPSPGPRRRLFGRSARAVAVGRTSRGSGKVLFPQGTSADALPGRASRDRTPCIVRPRPNQLPLPRRRSRQRGKTLYTVSARGSIGLPATPPRPRHRRVNRASRNRTLCTVTAPRFARDTAPIPSQDRHSISTGMPALPPGVWRHPVNHALRDSTPCTVTAPTVVRSLTQSHAITIALRTGQ